MRYHIIYSVFCMMLYAARGSGQLIGGTIDTSKVRDSPLDWPGEYTRTTVDLEKAQIFRNSKWKVHSSRTLFSVSSLSSETGSEKNSRKKSIRNNTSVMATNPSSMDYIPESSNNSEIHNDRRRNVEYTIGDDFLGGEDENLAQPVWQVRESSRNPTGSSSSGSQYRLQSPGKLGALRRKEILSRRKAKQAEVVEENVRRRNRQRNDFKRNFLERKTAANISRRNIHGSNFLSIQAPKNSYVLDNYVPGQNLHFHGKSKRGFQLVPLPRNVYVLKEEMQSPEEQASLPDYSSRHLIDAPSYSAPLFENVGHHRPRLSRDRTSAMLSFKAHMHHDVKNIGNNFRRKISDRNLRFANSGNSPTDSVDSRSDGSEPSGPSSFNSPDSLQDDSASYLQAPNYQNFDDISSGSLSNDLANDPNPLIAAPSYSDFSSPLQNGNPDSPSFVNSFEENQLPYDKWDIPDSRNPLYRASYNDPSIYQSPLVDDKYSWMDDSEYNEPRHTFDNVDNLGRDVRQSYDDQSTSKYSLKYLDRYAKALSSMDENYSNDLEDISSKVEDQNNAANDFGGQRETADSIDVDDPSAQPQESLDDIEKEISGQNDISLRTRDTSFLNNEQVEPALSPTDLMSNLNTDDADDSPDLSSFGEKGNAVNDNQVKIKERSFSNVIAPLTAELQNLLSTIKLVNENLTREGNGELPTDEETQNKREISSPEKTRRKRHHEVLQDNSDEVQRDINENDPQTIERSDHEQKRFIDYSQGVIKPDVVSKKQKKYSSVSENSEPQAQDAIELTPSPISINTSVTEITQGTKQKRNPGVIDFLEKTFGIGTHDHRSVTEATATVFATLETDADDTGSFSGSKEGPDSSRSEQSTDGITTKQETTEKPVKNAEVIKHTKIPEQYKEKITPTSITTASSPKTEYPPAGETHELTDQPNDSNENSEKIETTSSPNSEVEVATNHQSIAPEIYRSKSGPFSVIDIKPTMAAIIDVPTVSRNILSAHANGSIFQGSPDSHQPKEALAINPSYVAETSNDTSSNLSPIISNFTDTSSVLTQTSSSPLAEPSKIPDVVAKPSHKLGEQTIAIDFSEFKKARESGVQDFLVKLMSPEVVRNIINDGVVVRIPSARTSSPSLFLSNNDTNFQHMANTSENVELNDQKFNRAAAIATRSHTFTPEIQADRNYESRNKVISASSEVNIPDGGNISRSFVARNNDPLSTHTEAKESRYYTSSNTRDASPNSRTKSKSKSIEDTVVAISGDDTGGNARVDITLKIPIHQSQNQHEIVSRDSQDENTTNLEQNENGSKTSVTDNPIKRSAYKDYGDAEDYDEYLRNDDLDSSEDYGDHQSVDSPDAEEIYANAYLDALESKDFYEDDYEPENLADDRVDESPRRDDLGANVKSPGRKNNLKPSKPYIWPEHFGQTLYSHLDTTDSPKDSSTPLYQLPKRLQGNRKHQKNRDNNKKSKTRSKSKKNNITLSKKKSERTTSLNSKKPSFGRLGRKLQSMSGFACNRKLFSFGELDYDVDEQLLTKPIAEFEMEQHDPLTMDLPDEPIAEVEVNPIDFYTTFEPETSILDMEGIDIDFDVTPASEFALRSVLSPPILPSPTFRENNDETEMFDRKNDAPALMTEASTQSLVCSYAKTPRSIDEMIAKVLTVEEPILTTDQTPETVSTTGETIESVLATGDATEILLAADETTETVSSTEETIERISTDETEDTADKTPETTPKSAGKRRENKTIASAEGTIGTIGITKVTTEEIESTEEATEQNTSKLKANTKIKKAKNTTAPTTLLKKFTTAKETTAISQITPTFSAIPMTTLESHEESTIETEETTEASLIKTMTAPKTTETLSADLLPINLSKTEFSVSKSSPKSHFSIALPSRKTEKKLMTTSLPINLTSHIFTTTLSTELSRKMRGPKSKTKSKKSMKSKSNTKIMSQMPETATTEEPSSETPEITTATGDGEQIDQAIKMRDETSKKAAKLRGRRYWASNDEEQELTTQPEIIVEIAEETTASAESAATNNVVETERIEETTVISTIVEDYADDRDTSMLQRRADVSRSTEKTTLRSSKIAEIGAPSNAESTEKGFGLVEDSVPVILRAAANIPKNNVIRAGLGVQRTTEVQTKLTEEYVIQTTPLPLMMKSVPHLDQKILNSGSTKEFDMLVTLPKILKRPGEEPLTALNKTRVTPEIFPTTIISSDNLEVGSLAPERELRSSEVSPPEDDGLAAIDEDAESDTENYEKIKSEGGKADDDADDETTTKKGSSTQEEKERRKSKKDKTLLIEARKKLKKRLKDLRKKEEELKQREVAVQQKREEVKHEKAEREKKKQKTESEKLRKNETRSSTSARGTIGTTESPVSTKESTEMTESSVPIEEPTETTESSDSIEKSTDMAESPISNEESTEMIESSVSIEKLTEVTELPVSTDKSTEMTESSVSTVESTETTESPVSIEDSTETTESSVPIEAPTETTESSDSIEKSTDTAESPISTEESTEMIESSVSIEKLTEVTELPVSTDKSTEMTESSVATVELIETTETPVSTEESTETTESSVSSEESTDTAESPISNEESTEMIESSVSIEKLTEVTELPVSTDKSTEMTESSVATVESTETTETPVSTEESTETTESSVPIEAPTETTESSDSIEKSTDTAESPISTEESTEMIESSVSIEKLTEVTELPVSTDKSTEMTESSVATVESIETTETPVSTEESTETTESSVSSEESTDTAESPISNEESTEMIESSVSIEKLTEVTELPVSTDKSTEMTESSVATVESTETTETPVSTEESTETTESSVSSEESTETPERSVSTDKSTEVTESSDTVEKSFDTTESSPAMDDMTFITQSEYETEEKFTDTTETSHTTSDLTISTETQGTESPTTEMEGETSTIETVITSDGIEDTTESSITYTESTGTTETLSSTSKKKGSKKTSSKNGKLTSTTSTKGKMTSSKKTSNKNGKQTSTTEQLKTKAATTDAIEVPSSTDDLTISTETQSTESPTTEMEGETSTIETVITSDGIEDTTEPSVTETESTGTTETLSSTSKKKGSKKTSSKNGKLTSTTSTETQGTESAILEDETSATEMLIGQEQIEGTIESSINETELTCTSETLSSRSNVNISTDILATETLIIDMKNTTTMTERLSTRAEPEDEEVSSFSGKEKATELFKTNRETIDTTETSGMTSDITTSTDTIVTDLPTIELEDMTSTEETLFTPEEIEGTSGSAITETGMTGMPATSSATGKKEGSKKPSSKIDNPTSTAETLTTGESPPSMEGPETTTESSVSMDGISVTAESSEEEMTPAIETKITMAGITMTTKSLTTTDETGDLDEEDDEALNDLSVEELEQELERIENEVKAKEKEIEEREKQLKRKEMKVEEELKELKEAKKFEKKEEKHNADKEEDLEMMEESTTESTSESTLEWTTAMSTEQPLEESSQPTPIPPIEETSRPIQPTMDESKKNKKGKRNKCKHKKKPKTAKSRGYVFDEEEEVWRKKRPEGYARATIEPIPAELYKRAAKETEVNTGDENLEEEITNNIDEEETDAGKVTKKVCLHALHDELLLADSQKHPIEISEVVGRPYNPEEMDERGPRGHGRVARKLMDHDDDSSTPKVFKLQGKTVSPGAKVSPDKRHGKKNPNHLKVDHLILQHHEWKNGETTPELHSPTGFTRVYEIRSKNAADAGIVGREGKDETTTDVKREANEIMNFDGVAMEDEFLDAEGDSENYESSNDEETEKIKDVTGSNDVDYQDEMKSSKSVRKRENKKEEELDETEILDDDDIEKQIEEAWSEYGDGDETEDNPTNSKNMKTRRTVSDEKKKLVRLDKQLSRREASLRKEEDDVRKEEEELMASEQLLDVDESKIPPHRSRIGKRRILESDKELELWNSEFVDSNHMIRKRDRSRAISNYGLRLKKRPFTVKVLRLEYDEDEESHKMKSYQPSPEEMVVKMSDEMESQHDDDEANDENLDVDPEAPSDDADENEDGVKEKVTTECSENEEIIVPESRASGKKSKTRNPPGSEWPTERTSKYHTGGTMTWDKEFPTLSKELRRARGASINQDDRISDDSDEHVNNRETRNRLERPMCYSDVVKSSKFKFEPKNNENQIDRPMLMKRYRNRRWRSINNKRRNPLPSKNSPIILKRDVLGRKLSSFDGNPERGNSRNLNYKTKLKSRKKKGISMANVKSKIRSKKSIDCAETEENSECNEGYDNDSDYKDEKTDNYEDDEETNDYDDTNDDSDDFLEDEEDFSSLTEDDPMPPIDDFADINLAPTEGIITSKKGRIIEVTKRAREFLTTPSVKQSKVHHNGNVTDSAFSNVTTEIINSQGFTQRKHSNAPQNSSLEVGKNIHENIVTLNPLLEEDDLISVSESITVYTNPQNEESIKTLIPTNTPEEPTKTLSADFHQNRLANRMIAENPSHYHFSAEYADYEQDAEQDKKKLSVFSRPEKLEALRIPKEMEKKIGNLENEERSFEPKSAIKGASSKAGHQTASLEKDAGVNKTLPIFVKLDDAKLFELKNLPKPPAEIYVIYKCGPPVVVGEYSSTETSDGNKVTTTMNDLEATMKELTTDSVAEKVGVSVKDTSDRTNDSSEIINVREKLNPEVESARLEDKEIEFVPLCGGKYAENDPARSLMSATEQTTMKETFDVSGIPGELTIANPVTTDVEQDISLPTEISVSPTSLGTELTSVGSSSLRPRVRAADETERQEEIGPKMLRGTKKLLDFSNARKRQSPGKELFSRKDRKRFVSRNTGKSKKENPLQKYRSSRSLDSRLNSVENWQAEVNLDKKDTTTQKFGDEKERRNVISSYDDLELDDEIPNGSDLDHDLETVDRTGRSLLGLDPFSEGHENKSRIEDNKESFKNRQGRNGIISTSKKRHNSRRLKGRVLRNSNKKSSTGKTQAGFRKSPALDSGVLEEDDNPVETSSLLDKVMDMINPKDPPDKIGQGNKPGMEGLEDAEKEKKPRSLLERVKDIISNAIGLGKRDQVNVTTKAMDSVTTTPRTVPDVREKSLLYDAEKMLASLTTLEPNEPTKKSHGHTNNDGHPKRHNSKKHKKRGKNHSDNASKISSKLAATTKKKNGNSTGANKKKSPKKKSDKKSSSRKKSKQNHQTTSTIVHSKNGKSHRKLVFKNKTTKLNTSEIIPRIRDLVKKQNLGSVEKIIVYVDKYAKNNDNQITTNPTKKLHRNSVKKGASKIRSPISKKDITFRLNLKSPKLLRSFKNKDSDFLSTNHMASQRRNIEESDAASYDNQNFPDQLDNGKLIIDGLSLETVVSRVADEILKSVERSENDSQNSDTDIPITVMQTVANGTESPAHKMTTEFLVDTFKEKHQSSSSSDAKNRKFVKNSKKSVNFHKSSRLTSKVSKRRMNLPDVPRKNRRRNWKKKIKREDEQEKENRDRNLNIIRRRLLRELTRKLAERRTRHSSNQSRIRRSLLRNENEKLKLKSVPEKHNNHNEKIRIIYSMERKNETDRNARKNQDHLQNSKNQKQNSRQHTNKRHKRNEDMEANEYFVNGEKMNVGEAVEKIDDFSKDSNISPASQDLSIHQSRISLTNDSEDNERGKKRKIFDLQPIPDDQEFLQNNTTNEISSKYNIADNDTIFYNHMLDMEKELLNKSNSRSASSPMEKRNAKLSKCSENSKNLCGGKYERMKKLVHAGVHYLLRRFDDCENCKNELSSSEPNISSSLIKTKRDDHESLDVENMAKKIINFASKIDSHHCEGKKARNADVEIEKSVEKFGIDELGLKSEKDKKSLAALINEIVDVQKNVNQTLEIIKTRSSNNGIKKIEAERSIRNSNPAGNSNKQRTKNEQKDRNKSLKNIRWKKKQENSQKEKSRKKSEKKSTRKNEQIKSNEFEKTDKKVKKSSSHHAIEKKNSAPTNKKKLKSSSNPEGHLDEIGKEIRAILIEENNQDPKGPILDAEKAISNTSRKSRNVEMTNNDIFPRYARDIDDTNIPNFGKYRVRRVRSIAWNRAHLPSEDREETIFQNFPKFLDLTNIDTDQHKNNNKNDTSEETIANSTNPSPKFSTNTDLRSSYLGAMSSDETLKQVSSMEPSSNIEKKKTSETIPYRSENLKKTKKSKKKPENWYEKHHHPRKKGEKPIAKVPSRSKNTKKPISKEKKSTTSPSIHADGALKWKLTGHVNFVAEPPDRKVNSNIPPSHFSVRRKLQSSPRIAGPRHSRDRSTNRKTKKATKRRQIRKRSIKKNSKFAVTEGKVSRHNEKRESQTVIPMHNGHIRVKYIYRDATVLHQNHTNDFLKNHNPEVRGITEEMENFRKEQKSVFATVPPTEHQSAKNNCATCICDIVETVEELKNILIARGDTLMKIINYECPKYEEVGDKIILSSTGIIGDILPKSRRDLAEAKGMTYIKPEDLEDVLRGGFKDEKNDNDLMSFPGNDIYVPCNRDGDDVTWLTSISRPNYTWVRDDGSPVSGLIRKNGNLELYDVDSKDSANYTCFVSYIDPDNEELVQNEYVHRIQVVTLPRYTLRGGNRYELENCDETVLDVLASHLPRKLNDILCKKSVCDAFIYAPRCYHKQISIRALIMPSSTAKLFPVGGSQCGLRCKKAVQDKVALMLSKNLRIVLQKPIVFRLPHRSEDKLVPIINDGEKKSRNKRGRSKGNGDVDGQVGLLVGCPAGYGFRDGHCFPCSPGSHSDNMGSRCKKCPEGTHQPNTGARTCRSCTNPFVEGCYQMLWNSSSAVMAILVSLSAVITIFTILVWMLCCGKGRKSNANGSCARSTEIELKYQQGTVDRSLRQPLIEPYRDLTEDDERWCDCEQVKKKKKRLLRKKLLPRDGEGLDVLAHQPAERHQRSIEPDQKIERVKIVPISCIDSYRSHGGRQSKNTYPKRYDYAKPPLPLPDFPR